MKTIFALLAVLCLCGTSEARGHGGHGGGFRLGINIGVPIYRPWGYYPPPYGYPYYPYGPYPYPPPPYYPPASPPSPLPPQPQPPSPGQ
jgi:hypothetical protein